MTQPPYQVRAVEFIADPDRREYRVIELATGRVIAVCTEAFQAHFVCRAISREERPLSGWNEADNIRLFVQQILHGDEQHRRWLLAAAEAYIEGADMPSLTLATPPAHDPGHPHLIDGEFQSDKYPSCPRGKVPLSTKDPTAQDLLWIYKERRRAVDPEFADDLEQALRLKGYAAPVVDYQRLHELVDKLLALDQPWSLLDVLGKLVNATDHLLHDHDCDHHGYEAIDAAKEAARRHLVLLRDILRKGADRDG